MTAIDYATAYEGLHKAKGGKYFGGKVHDPQKVAALVARCQPTNLLDYGCGKGKQYTEKRIHESWGIMPTLYDIGVPAFRKKPAGQFDGIICCDMMEHIHPDDVDTVLADIFSYSSAPRDGGQLAFVYLYISCVPSKGKRLPDGRNVHLTVEPPTWWDAKLVAYQRDGLIISAGYDEQPIEEKQLANPAKARENQ